MNSFIVTFPRSRFESVRLPIRLMVTNSAVRNHEAISAEFGRGKINSDEPCSFRDAFKLRVSVSIPRRRNSQHRQTEGSRSGRRHPVRIGHIFGDGCPASETNSATTNDVPLLVVMSCSFDLSNSSRTCSCKCFDKGVHITFIVVRGERDPNASATCTAHNILTTQSVDNRLYAFASLDQ